MKDGTASSLVGSGLGHDCNWSTTGLALPQDGADEAVDPLRNSRRGSGGHPSVLADRSAGTKGIMGRHLQVGGERIEGLK